LASQNSQLSLGGTNSTFFTGPIEHHPLSFNTGLWQIGNAHVNVNDNRSIINGFQTITDSGIATMYGPPQAANVYSLVPGSRLFDVQNGFYVFPCAKCTIQRAVMIGSSRLKTSTWASLRMEVQCALGHLIVRNDIIK